MWTNGERYLSEKQFSFLKRKSGDGFDPAEWKKMNFGNNLEHWRTRNGMRLVDLANKLHEAGFDFTTQLIGEIETGKKKPSMDFMYALCMVFDASMDELFFAEVKGDPGVISKEYLEVFMEAQVLQVDPGDLKSAMKFIKELKEN